jgi:CubicO group peptidase (beta-lactamase class C family)
MAAFLVIDDEAEREGAQRNLIVPWWSFTKTILAAAALRLCDQGRLSLDAPRPGAAFTLRQLLHHSSGLPDYASLEAYHRAVERNEEPWRFADLVERAGPPLFAPGEGWSYSNIGYTLVGQAIAEAAGQPVTEALRELVLEPLGAESARLALSRADLDGVADSAAYHPGWVYHGLVVGPVAEAAALLHNLMSGDLISQATREAMTTGRILAGYERPPWSDAGYGLGMMIPRVGGASVYGHTGDGPTSLIAVYALRRGDGWRTVAFWAADSEGFDVEVEAVARLVS